MTPDAHHRQRELVNQLRLQEAQVVIVGAGGTGSAAATQLAHAGVGTIHIVDKDKIEITNLNRVYGARPNHINDEVAKVDILHQHLKDLPGIQIYAHPVAVPDSDIEKLIQSADIVLGCVDRHQPRHWLNEVCRKHGVRLIDVGCKAAIRPDGTIDQLVAEVRVVDSEGPCLYCYEAIDPERLRLETLSPEQLAQEVADGYANAAGAEHSIIQMTTMGATVQTSQAIAHILGQPTNWPSRVIVDAWGAPRFMPPVRTDCHKCNPGGEP